MAGEKHVAFGSLALALAAAVGVSVLQCPASPPHSLGARAHAATPVDDVPPLPDAGLPEAHPMLTPAPAAAQ
jgi:hypothetical protein